MNTWHIGLAASGLVLLAASVLAVILPGRYLSELPVPELAIPVFVMAFCFAGLVFLCAVWAVYRLTQEQQADHLILFWLIFAVGLTMRVVLFVSAPVLEDDYHRYLWDGAVTAEAGNPYRFSPDEIIDGQGSGPPYERLAAAGGATLERINYPQYRTIYPPVTQAFFALAYKIAPFSFQAWKLVLLALDITIAGLIVFLLQSMGRSVLWLIVYWWNPLVAKEIFNSGHMEPVVIVFVLGALALTVAKRPVLGGVMLGLAAAAKLWPVVLLPAILRFGAPTLWQSALRAIVFSLTTAVLMLPVLISGLGPSSGFVAFAQKWQTNSALFLVWDQLAQLWPLAWPEAGALARLMAGSVLAAGLLWVCRQPARSREAFLQQAFFCCVALFLLSPTQFPWYYVWVAPLLCLFPSRGLILATALLPLYYLYFHLAPRGLAHVQIYGVVWLIWLPVWGLLLHDLLRRSSPAGNRSWRIMGS